MTLARTSTLTLFVQRYATLPSSIFHSFNQEELKVAAKVAYVKNVAPGQVWLGVCLGAWLGLG